MIWINLWLGKYHILSVLDSLSPNPHVFLASHVKLNEYRVIKKISKAHPFFKQLKKEAEFLSEYSSDFMPKLYDVEEDGENLYLVEEYVQGMNLVSKDLSKSKLKEMELVNIAAGLFDFLKFINSLEDSVLYIDWKPGNIIFTKTGVKIVDFGSVICLENDESTPLATAGFAAPELKKGGGLGRYTDIYGFGSVVKYLVDRAEVKKSLFKNTKRDRLLALSMRCTKEKPEERPDMRTLERNIHSIRRKSYFSGPKVQDKNIISNTAAGRIGVCGNAKGVGTTHIAFCIAEELAKQKKNVAYVSIGNVEEALLLQRPEGLKNVQIYQGVCEEDMLYLIKKGFDNIVFDFGKVEDFSLLFHSCDEKIVVIQNNFIKGGEIEDFFVGHRDDIGETGWMVLDNLSDETRLESTKTLLKNTGLKVRCKGIGIERI